MRTIAVLNQKGGVGKTTTVANLGGALGRSGKDICLVDMDPQVHLTLHFGQELADGSPSVYDLLTRQVSISDVAVKLNDRLCLLPASVDLAATETELAGETAREHRLAEVLRAHSLPTDFVLIDCPPALGLLTLNALAAADDVLIPLQPQFLALQGLGKLLETIALVHRHINPRLRVLGVVLCMYESVTRLTGEVVADLETFLAAERGNDSPWSEARIFRTCIRRNVKLAECPSFGQTIFDYEPRCHGAEDYAALGEEFLACHAPPADPSPPSEPAIPPPMCDPTTGRTPPQAGPWTDVPDLDPRKWV